MISNHYIYSSLLSVCKCKNIERIKKEYKVIPIIRLCERNVIVVWSNQ